MVKNLNSVTFVCEHLGKGGAERVMSILIKNYVNAGWRVQLVLLYEDLIEYSIPDSVKKVFLSFDRKHSLSEIISRRRKLRSTVTGDVVVTFLYAAIRDTVFSMIGSKKVLVISDRSDPGKEPPGKFRRCLRTLSYYFADKIVFQTDDAKKYFPRRLQKKGYVIPNPVSSQLPKFDLNKANKTIVAVGRLVAQKNFSLLFKAFSRLSADFPDYTLKIYGRGELEEELKNLAYKLKISDKVHFLGYVTDVNERMREASMYVSSSIYEGISNSMLEAMAMGIPTICTDCPIGGARKTINNRVNGILVPVDDEDALYHAMKEILSDKTLAKTLSENSQSIKTNLSEDVIFERWLKITQSILGNF